jgi:hypothetical protein
MNVPDDRAAPPPALTLMCVLCADGIVVHGLRYQSAALQKLRRSGVDRSVKVRIDLLDIRQVFVWSGSDWICAQLHFDEAAADLFRERSGKQLVRWIDEVYAARAGDKRA